MVDTSGIVKLNVKSRPRTGSISKSIAKDAAVYYGTIALLNALVSRKKKK